MKTATNTTAIVPGYTQIQKIDELKAHLWPGRSVKVTRYKVTSGAPLKTLSYRVKSINTVPAVNSIIFQATTQSGSAFEYPVPLHKAKFWYVKNGGRQIDFICDGVRSLSIEMV